MGVLLDALAVPLFLAPGVATTWPAARVNAGSAADLDAPIPGSSQV